MEQTDCTLILNSSNVRMCFYVKETVEMSSLSHMTTGGCIWCLFSAAKLIHELYLSHWMLGVSLAWLMLLVFIQYLIQVVSTQLSPVMSWWCHEPLPLRVSSLGAQGLPAEIWRCWMLCEVVTVYDINTQVRLWFLVILADSAHCPGFKSVSGFLVSSLCTWWSAASSSIFLLTAKMLHSVSVYTLSPHHWAATQCLEFHILVCGILFTYCVSLIWIQVCRNTMWSPKSICGSEEGHKIQ